ncbi:hypothetical protein EQ832_10250 [Pseudomonas sp. ALS1131]|nr:hypothetical protein [Pseudomonas sp. ALS1131]TRO39783.1 hypothetical protein EQ832_10250 [Pseudomonas sp. ALS1131]
MEKQEHRPQAGFFMPASRPEQGLQRSFPCSRLHLTPTASDNRTILCTDIIQAWMLKSPAIPGFQTLFRYFSALVSGPEQAAQLTGLTS